jgi:rhamnose transport system permease protein
MSDLLAKGLSSADGSAPRTYKNYDRPLWRRLLLNQESFVIALLIIVAVVASMSIDHFATTTTLNFLLLDATPSLLIAMPMALVIITGEIDLSVGSIVGLSSVSLGFLSAHGWPIGLAMLAALVVGVLCGLINGLLVTLGGLPSLAVTIGTLALFRGLAVGILGTTSIVTFPAFWTDLTQATIGDTGIPVVMIVVVVVIALFALLLHFTAFGRGIFAIGLSKDAATFGGIGVGRTKLILFILSGLVSGFVGIYWTYLYGTAQGNNATGLELAVIAPVLLGGVSVFGGKGALPGVIGGVLLIGVLQSALRLANVSSDGINILTGILLIVSVISTTVFAWVRRRRPTARAPKTTGVDSRTRS